MSTSSTPTVAPAATPAGNPARKKALTALSIVVLLGLAYGGFGYFGARHSEETDNAYVQGNVIQITPQVGGTVTAIMADDTDFVKAGQALVKLDPADAKVALDQAEANLAQAVRQVRTLYANNGTLSAQVTLRESDIARAQTDIARATDDLNRRQALAGNGAVSKEELNHAKSQLTTAQNALSAAQAGVAAAREQLSSNQTLTEGTNVESHPSVVAAMRGLDLGAVRATEAGLYFGANAVSQGLADGIQTLEATLSEFHSYLNARNHPPSQVRGVIRAEAAPLKKEMTMNEEEKVIETADTISTDEAAVLVAEARREVTQAAQAIAEVCLLAGYPDRAAEFIAAGKTEADVRRVLIDARAARSEADDIRSTITVDAGTQKLDRPEASPIVAAVKKLTATA